MKRKPPINGHNLNGTTPRRETPQVVAVKAQCCPICQRPMFDDSDALLVTPLQKRILDLLQRSGQMTSDILYTALWGGDPDGGPGLKNLDVHINQLNKRLKKYGIAIRRRRPKHPGEPWRLVQLMEAAE